MVRVCTRGRGMEKFLKDEDEGSGGMPHETAEILCLGSAVHHSSLLKAPDCSLNCVSICITLESNLLWGGEQCPHWILHQRGEGKPVLWLKLQTGLALSTSNIYFYSKTYSIVIFVVKYFCDNAVNKTVLLNFFKLCFLIFSLPEGLENAL